jgi:diguanylate cyclase (GGDEF)-like protein
MANRRFFDRTIEQEFRRALRTGQPISVIMIDIDRFKDYNDSYGYPPVGDECLCVIARTLQSCLRRAADLAARYGWRRICHAPPRIRRGRCLHLRDAAGRAQSGIATLCNPDGIVTFSAGIATSVPARTARGWEALVKDADAVLYAAEVAGPDMVKTCPSTSPAIGSTAGACGQRFTQVEGSGHHSEPHQDQATHHAAPSGY